MPPLGKQPVKKPGPKGAKRTTTKTKSGANRR